MKLDFNLFETIAQRLIDSGQHREAVKVYLYMADGDPSLDGGYLGHRLGECYEALGDFHAGSYWYGRAIQENPEVYPMLTEVRRRLHVGVKTGLKEHGLTIE